MARLWAVTAPVIAAALLGLPARHGQGSASVVQRETIHARNIEGTLDDVQGQVVQHARVEVFRCPVKWPNGAMNGEILRTGETDEQGKFKIDDVNGDQLRCVRFSRSGFKPLIVRVKLTAFTWSKMRLTMQIAR
jgi:hypothetical protein